MQAFAFIEKLNALGRTMFSVTDAERVLAKPRPYVRIYLHRLERKGLILRIERGKYILRDVDPVILSTGLSAPSYISFLFAFYLHGLTTQIPIRIQAVTSSSRKKIAFEEVEVEFVKFKPDKIFGYRKRALKGGYVFLAEKEKAIIDCLYYNRNVVSGSDINNAIPQCDSKKLVAYALKMGSAALAQRLGYLLSLNGAMVSLSLRKMVGKNYIPLNLALPKKGKRDAEWKLIINEAIE